MRRRYPFILGGVSFYSAYVLLKVLNLVMIDLVVTTQLVQTSTARPFTATVQIATVANTATKVSVNVFSHNKMFNI